MADTIELKSIESGYETPTTISFYFTTEGSGPDYDAGQYISLKIADVDDPRGPQRPFTLSSSPTEDRISLTMKETDSPFKEALEAIADQKDGLDRLKMRGPMGNFTHEPKRPALMIAGGIGITPFRSMIRYRADTTAKQPIVLLYSNQTPEEIAFRDELDRIADENDWLSMYHTITRPEEAKQDWDGPTGRISKETIAEQGEHLEKPIYYVCGPSDMVTAMIGILQDELDVSKDDIRFEKFTGY